MVDFTSALYLGLRHASWSGPHWPALTLGKPAALEEPPGVRGVERDLAALTGCERVVLGSSTLHLFLDLFAMLAGPGTGIFLDERSYPIAQWATRQAALSGSGTTLFRGGEPAFAAARLREALQHAPAVKPGVRPVIVTDGLHPASGTPAPIADYVELARQRGGLVVVDDTQALGILGMLPERYPPYGAGGGGSLQQAGFGSNEVVVVSSLAKAFGAPVAMLGGSAAMVEQFRFRSLTRMHCSPPSVASIAAAAGALQENQYRGDGLRACLARNVSHLRQGLTSLGLAASRSLFPVQPIYLPPGIAAPLHAGMMKLGVRTVLHGNSIDRSHISFLVTARHAPREIAIAIAGLADALAQIRRKNTAGVSYENQSEFRSRAIW